MTKTVIPPSVLKAFFKEHDKTREIEEQKARQRERLVIEKQKMLTPVKAFLRGLTTLGVQLKNGRSFQFYERESSPSWQPGFSLFFDHPSPVEIAIPNNAKRDGKIVIRVASVDPDSFLLEKKFDTVEEGMEVLAAYLGKHCTSLEIDPRNKEKSQEAIERQRENFKEIADDVQPNINNE